MTFPFPIRKIIHIDMDAFYASVEQLDHPELRGRAVAVGGASRRGVVAAASYEARAFGVRSAMSGFQAKKNCPELIFVKPRFERYREISEGIRYVFYEYTDLVEPLSLDEAYLDVTENKKGNPSATLIAMEIRKRIFTKFGLTASAGISVNKFLAKVASDYNKPNGQKTVNPEEVLAFMEALDIRKFYGVGKVTAEKMYRLGIFTGKDLKKKSVDFLNETFGKNGRYYYQVVRGIHHSEVKAHRKVKSVGAERTFNDNLSSEVFMLERLTQIAGELEKRLEKNKISGRTITLKIRYSDFTLHTRSKTLQEYVTGRIKLLQIAEDLLYQEPLENSVRLLGIALSNLKTFDNDQHDPPELSEEKVSVQLKFDL